MKGRFFFLFFFNNNCTVNHYVSFITYILYIYLYANTATFTFEVQWTKGAQEYFIVRKMKKNYELIRIIIYLIDIKGKE